MDYAEHFKDNFANDISWEPLMEGGTNMHTRELRQDINGNFCFVRTKEAKTFLLIPYAVGYMSLLMLFIFPLLEIETEKMFYYSTAIFIPLAHWISYKSLMRIHFDIEGKSFSKELRSTFKVEQNGLIKQKRTLVLSFEEIYSLQLLKEFHECKTGEGSDSFYSYELNLILKDQSRVAVIEHGNPEDLKKDAEQLANTLNIPLWDAI